MRALEVFGLFLIAITAFPTAFLGLLVYTDIVDKDYGSLCFSLFFFISYLTMLVFFITKTLAMLEEE